MAKREPDVAKYTKRLKELETFIQNGFNEGKAITLSTVHSAKGLEYDTVYMIDVYDGRFPSSRRNRFNRSKDSSNWEMEERRLFYVGITRAKNELKLFSISDLPSSYIDSLFPEIRKKREEEKLRKAAKEREERNRQLREKKMKQLEEQEQKRPIEAEEKHKAYEQRRIAEEEKRRIDEEKAKIIFYNEVKDRFTQQTEQIRDSRGVRWIQCEKCGKIRPEREFRTYGGSNHMNLGLCYECEKNQG